MCPDLGVGPWFSTRMNSHSALAGSIFHMCVSQQGANNESSNPFPPSTYTLLHWMRTSHSGTFAENGPQRYTWCHHQKHMSSALLFPLAICLLCVLLTIDECLVEKTRISAVKKKGRHERNVNIYLYARRKSKDPKSRCRELARRHTLKEKKDTVSIMAFGSCYSLFILT